MACSVGPASAGPAVKQQLFLDLARAAERERSPEALAEDERQTWGTPMALFAGIDAEARFTFDACASPETAKCPDFWTIDDDALAHTWGPEVYWCNYPFAKARPWHEKALEAVANGGEAWLLGNISTGAKWFYEVVVPHADWWTFRGRVAFVPPLGVMPSTNDRDSVLCRYHRGPLRGYMGTRCPKTGRA